MAAAVLGLESIVLFLTTPVMIQISDVRTGLALTVGVGMALLAVLLCAMLRFRWAYVAGTVLQAGAIGMGFIVPMMFVLGAVFAALWAVALVFGQRIERLKAERGAG
ncbi:MAG: DUF4233 domain-containing protein [Propionibacteriales bacterium]|nr:DUF4233 domain-containing protein [Propionibacteriales bacterium]